MAPQTTLSVSPRRLAVSLWVAAALSWIAVCAVTLRPDKDVSILLRYCGRSSDSFACAIHPSRSTLRATPNLGNVEKDLLFFLVVSFGTPLFVLAMSRAARWAAGSNGHVAE